MTTHVRPAHALPIYCNKHALVVSISSHYPHSEARGKPGRYYQHYFWTSEITKINGNLILGPINLYGAQL